jgi:hypothetical protein
MVQAEPPGLLNLIIKMLHARQTLFCGVSDWLEPDDDGRSYKMANTLETLLHAYTLAPKPMLCRLLRLA